MKFAEQRLKNLKLYVQNKTFYLNQLVLQKVMKKLRY